MNVDRDRFLEEGYLILRQVIAPGDLERLRRSCASLLEKQQEVWVREREGDDPPGGEWEKSAQPRLMMGQVADQVDKHSIGVVEIWLHENIQGVSSELLGVEDAGVNEMMMMCNPVCDYGTSGHNGWHRDVYPPFSAPIQGYTDDIVENGPRYVQWNIPLYDDDVLWVKPGSHRRINTAEESEQLRVDRRVPLAGGVQTQLKAGDGVVYITPILHWGSKYDTTLRRTLHGGFSMCTQRHDISYAEHLSGRGRDRFARWNERSEHSKDLTAAALRAAIARDRAGYYATLEELHPGRGEKGRALTSMWLSKTAKSVNDLRRPDSESLAQSRRNRAVAVHPLTLDWGAAFAERFSPQEGNAMWERFRALDEGLQADTELAPPPYEERPSLYYFYDVPEGLDVAALIDGWDR